MHREERIDRALGWVRNIAAKTGFRNA